MRKLCIVAASCIALVAYVGLSAQAFAWVVDTSCDLDAPSEGDGVPGPYNNDFAVRDFSIATDSNKAYEVSGLTGGGLACGTRINGTIANGREGEETLNDHAEVSVPPGVAINSTASMDDTAYVGRALVNVASWVTDSWALVVEDNVALMRVDSIAACEAENQNLAGGPTPGTVVACYKGVQDTILLDGHNWNIVTEVPAPKGERRYTLTIGPFYNDSTGKPAGLTNIKEFQLCAYAGTTGTPGQAGECGDGSDPGGWLQKNGTEAVFPLPQIPCRGITTVRGGGTYFATVTDKSGDITEPARACPTWYPTWHNPGKRSGGKSGGKGRL